MAADFENFCALTRPRLVGALALHCGDRGVAEEIAQETLLRTWQRWDEVSTAAPRAWAYRVAFNLANSWHRRRMVEFRARRRNRSLASAEPDHAQAIAVRAAVAHLPPRRRTALLLRYYLDLSVNETAGVMQCSPGTVKALCAQAAASLQRHPSLVDVQGADSA